MGRFPEDSVFGYVTLLFVNSSWHSDPCNTWESLAQRQCHMLYLWKQHYENLKSHNKSHFSVCNYQTNRDICHTAVCQLFR
jgi:hypothetical protein